MKPKTKAKTTAPSRTSTKTRKRAARPKRSPSKKGGQIVMLTMAGGEHCGPTEGGLTLYDPNGPSLFFGRMVPTVVDDPKIIRRCRETPINPEGAPYGSERFTCAFSFWPSRRDFDLEVARQNQRVDVERLEEAERRAAELLSEALRPRAPQPPVRRLAGELRSPERIV